MVDVWNLIYLKRNNRGFGWELEGENFRAYIAYKYDYGLCMIND